MPEMRVANNKKIEKNYLKNKTPIETWQAFGPHWILWTCCGLKNPKPNSKWSKLYLLYAVCFNCLVTLFCPITFSVNLLFSKNLTELCENLYMTSTDIICSIQFLNIFIVRKKLLAVRDILQRLDYRAQTVEERQLLKQGIQSARKFFIRLMPLYILPVLTAQLVPILEPKRTLLYPAWFPWDWTATQTGFLCAYFYQSIVFLIQTLQNLGNDTYPQAYLVILSAHIRALGTRIRGLGEHQARDWYNAKKNEQQEPELFEELANCIKDHNIIFELARTIEQTIYTTCLLQFIATAIAQCTIAVYMLYVGVNISKLLNIIIFLCGITMQTFILCYYGDAYCQANEYLTEAIYSCNWTERDLRFQKAILLLLQRSQKSSVIMAGNLIPVQLPTFISLMKTAYSAFTVLNEMN